MASLFDFQLDLGADKAEKTIKSFSKTAGSELDKIISSTKDLQTEFDGLKVPTDSVEDAAKSFNNLQGTANKSLQTQKAALAQLITTGKKGTKEYKELEKQFLETKKRADELNKTAKELDSLGEIDIDVDVDVKGDGKLNNLKDTLGSFLKGGLIAGGVGAVAGSLAAVTKYGFEAEQAMSKFSAATGIVGDEAKEFRRIAENLFVQGFQDDLPSAIASVGKLQVALGSVATTDELEKIAPTLAGIAQTSGLEFDEVAAKTRTFVQNFGLNVEEAVGLVSAASQGAANAQEDVFDTLDEYSRFAERAGFSAVQFTNLLTEGVQRGARDTDKLADALKEASIRINAGDYRGAFDDISKGATEAERVYIDKINNIIRNAEQGNISIADALAITGDEVEAGVDAGVISDALREKLLVAVAGTPAEDIGTDLFGSLLSGLDAPEQQEEVSELAKKSAELYGKVFSSSVGGFEGIQRTFQVLAGQLGDLLLPVLNTLTTTIREILPVIQPVIEAVITSLLPIIVSLTDVIKEILPPIAEVVNVLLDALAPIIEEVGSLVGELVIAFKPLLIQFAELLKVILPPLVEILAVFVRIAGDNLVSVITFLSNSMAFWIEKVLIPLYSAIMPRLRDIFVSVAEKMDVFYGFIRKIIDGISRFLGGSKKATEAQKELNKEFVNGSDNIKAFDQELGGVQKTTDNTKKKLTDLSGAFKPVGDGFKKAASDAVTLEEEIKGLNTTELYVPMSIDNYDSVSSEFAQLWDEFQKYGQNAEPLDAEEFFSVFRDHSMISLEGIFSTESIEEEASRTKEIYTDTFGKLFASAGLDVPFFNIDTEKLQEVGAIFDSFILDFSEAKAGGAGFFESLKAGFDDIADGGEMTAEALNEVANVALNISGVFTDTFNEARESGDSYFESIIAGAGKALQATLNALAPTILAEAFKAFSWPGLAIGLATIATVNALLGGAEEGGEISASHARTSKPGKTDKFHYMLAEGEHVINAQSARKNRTLLEAINAGKDISGSYVDAAGNLRNITEMGTNSIREITGNVNIRQGTMSTAKIESLLTEISQKQDNHRVEIVDRGKVEISDNRTIYKKRGLYK